MFNLPTIPTDSLYKFLFIGGLILIIAAFTFSDRQYNSLKNDKVHQQLDSINFEIDQITKDHNTKENFIKSVNTQLRGDDYLDDYDLPMLFTLYRDSLQMSPSFKKRFVLLSHFADHNDDLLAKNIVPVRAMIGYLKKYEDSIYNPQTDTLQNMQNRYESKNQDLVNSLRVFNTYIYTSGILGGLFALVGITMWYTKLQRPQDEMLALQIAQLKETVKKQIIQDQLDLQAKKNDLERLSNEEPPLK